MIAENLVKRTNAYKILAAEKKRKAIAHATLVICSDGEYLGEYVKTLAKVVMCEEDEEGYCGKCRACRLIDKDAYTDCTFYPKDGKKILTADVDDLTDKTYVKPLENAKRLFCLVGAENMTAAAQNKILKTLEEPPENVHIIIGATKDEPILPTIKSRVTRLDIPPFPEKTLEDEFKKEFGDDERLTGAIAASGGKASEVANALNGGKTEKTVALCRDIMKNLNSSKDAVRYAESLDKDNIGEFITVLKREIMESVKDGTGEQLGFTVGAAIAIEDLLSEKERSLAFNANVKMTADAILFGIAKEKRRWQKS